MKIFNDENAMDAVNQVLFVKDEDILTRYPVDGYFEKNEDFDKDEQDKYMSEYNADEHGDFEEYMSMFEDEYIMLENEYANVGDIVYCKSGDVYTPMVVEEDWACEKYTSEWDGCNHRETILYSDIYESGIRDITDEIGDDFLDRSIVISSDYVNNMYTTLYYDAKLHTVLIHDSSAYMGTSDSYYFVENTDNITIAFLINAERHVIKENACYLDLDDSVVVEYDQSVETCEYDMFSKYTLLSVDDFLLLDGGLYSREGNKYEKKTLQNGTIVFERMWH